MQQQHPQQQRRYSFEHAADDDEPFLDDGRSDPSQPLQYHSPPRSPLNPASHPDSSFNRLRAARRYSQQQEYQHHAPSPAHSPYAPVSPLSPPQPPPHRDAEGRFWGQELGYTNAHSNITPGADNFGEQAAGGMTGLALGVADANARESGLEARRHTPGYDSRQTNTNFDPRMETRLPMNPNYDSQPQEYTDSRVDNRTPVNPYDSRMQNRPTNYDPRPQQYSDPNMDEYDRSMYDAAPYARPVGRQDPSLSSLTPLGAAAFPPGIATPQSRSVVSRSPQSFNREPYVDHPYQRSSRNLDPALTDFDPNTIEDDGDDGLEYRHPNRGSMLSLGHNSGHNSDKNIPAAAIASGGVLGAIGGLVGKKPPPAGGPQYDAVHDAYGAYAPTPGGAGGAGGAGSYNLGPEKSEWLSKKETGSKKMRWAVIIIVGLLIAGAITGGIVGGILSGNKKSSSSSSSSSQNPDSGGSAAGDTASNGDLNKNSAEIKKLMNNPNLHKVFPGIDYTPMYTQYPACLSYPASQNNVTRDLAVLSQLTNTIRLYGTDCNQTELLLHSIDQLGLNGTIKVWMGVWQDTNATTNARQLAQMYDIFNKHGAASIVGVIVGNEVLFREDMTATQLGAIITGVKSNLTSMGINIPIASSDLGDDWTSELAGIVDILMANIHPFFAGVTADVAASWTWSFWQNKDVALKSDISKNYISETGWPSKGGMDCGAATSCVNGSVAGITEMNTFMDGWVCDALTNGTNYFWFEAFDEPWKIQYDTAGKEWEDQWGLMDVNRNLKSGVVIPSCGGKTVS